MDIRKLKQSEHGMTRSLYEEVFSGDSRAFVDYYYSEKTKDNTIYVIADEKEVAAMIHLNPYELMVNGQQIPAHYIVAVATKMGFRKRGYMAGLLKLSMKAMYENNEPFTFLMPASESIYLPYDFRTVHKQNHRYFQNDEESRKAVPSDAKEIAEIAERFLSENYDVYAKRDEAYYQRLMKEYGADGGSLMVTEQDDKMFDCRPFVREEGDEASKIMVRIIDLERTLMLLRVKSLAVICFQVTDPVIAENNRCIVLTGTEFSGVMLMAGKPENSGGIITISALTELVFGGITSEEAAEKDGVQMTEQMTAELGKIIPLARIYLNETV